MRMWMVENKQKLINSVTTFTLLHILTLIINKTVIQLPHLYELLEEYSSHNPISMLENYTFLTKRLHVMYIQYKHLNTSTCISRHYN